MFGSITLDELARRTELPVRKLRYVVDDQLLIAPDNVKTVAEQRGRPRTFELGMAVIIASAAHLLEAGIRREAVRKYIGHLQNSAWMTAEYRNRPKDSRRRSLLGQEMLGHILCDMGGDPLSVQFGDYENVRLVGGLSGRWCQAATGALLDPSYAPKVVVELNLSAIRDQVMDV